MNNVLFSELQARKMLLAMVITRLNPVRSENTDDEYDDEGTWIWISMDTEYKLVLSHVVGERSQKSADSLVRRTAQCLKDIPLFVTDGLKFYRIALLKQYGRLQDFARTGKRGRLRLSRTIPGKLLK